MKLYMYSLEEIDGEYFFSEEEIEVVEKSRAYVPLSDGYSSVIDKFDINHVIEYGDKPYMLFLKEKDKVTAVNKFKDYFLEFIEFSKRQIKEYRGIIEIIEDWRDRDDE